MTLEPSEVRRIAQEASALVPSETEIESSSARICICKIRGYRALVRV
jgi:hypothetical protein